MFQGSMVALSSQAPWDQVWARALTTRKEACGPGYFASQDVANSEGPARSVWGTGAGVCDTHRTHLRHTWHMPWREADPPPGCWAVSALLLAAVTLAPWAHGNVVSGAHRCEQDSGLATSKKRVGRPRRDSPSHACPQLSMGTRNSDLSVPQGKATSQPALSKLLGLGPEGTARLSSSHCPPPLTPRGPRPAAAGLPRWRSDPASCFMLEVITFKQCKG